MAVVSEEVTVALQATLVPCLHSLSTHEEGEKQEEE